MGKGVAIPYIIALVIGLIVLVLVAYWIYRMFSTGAMSAEECKSKFIDWCTSCMNRRWKGGSLPQAISDCLKNSFNILIGVNESCENATAKLKCYEFGVR